MDLILFENSGEPHKQSRFEKQCKLIEIEHMFDLCS